MNNTNNNLSTFSTLYLVKGILTLCFSLFFILYGCIGFIIGNSEEWSHETDSFPFNPGLIFIVIGGIGFIISIVIGILTLMASKYLKDAKNYNFIFVLAVLNCLTGILGILLGIFTIIELTKPEVKQLFYKE
ncbi:hypothetical protein SB49_01780 [Sediminicola sp. YIK13]|uniref:hypothetical protein n=1 Tax=Sediminicola sp. YIK13 TaxID=1453352 RepID=UPI000722EFF2|nr:hypothetical protein [Sediminicola sp. YIK13]ALM06675.1 hypothetical protein SB49_01780 [Sediminicola sp. YIK13]